MSFQNFLKGFVFLFFICFSCSETPTEKEDICLLESCKNNGVVVDCRCECPEGYLGETCQRIDPTATQKLLDNGVSPFTLLSAGIQIDAVYGKNFQNGIIFHLNIIDNIVKITTQKDLEKKLQWTNAVNYCESLEVNGTTDWYLPNLTEVEEIRNILYVQQKVGSFEDDYYWTSVTVENSPNDAYGVFFLNGNNGPIEKDRMNEVSYNYVRAVRKIQL